MTSAGLKDQIRALIAQHFSQIETMMADAQSKESEAIYAGFAANREEQRKGSLEGEIAIWQSKMSVGQTIDTINQTNRIYAAEIVRQKVEKKVEELQKQQSNLVGLLQFLKDELASLKEAAQKSSNPLLDLFVAIFEIFTEVVEKLVDTEEEKQKLEKEKSTNEGLELIGLISGAEKKVQDQKDLQQSLLSQTSEKKSKVNEEKNIYNNKINNEERNEDRLYEHKEYFLDKIVSIQEQLKSEGKEVPVDKLMQFSNNEENGPKLIIDKSLSSIFGDLASLLGEDNVIMNRRENDRRLSNDRRNNNSAVESETRDDLAGRRKGDRRASDNYFL
ncbi:MAG: hypothetical protein AB1782_07415 [Cyanobacteriota bacterium]